MIRSLLIFSALFLPCFSFGQKKVNASNTTKKSQIQVRINANVELLGFVYFLGYEGRQSETDPEYSAKNKARYAYGLDLYRRYKKFENSPHLAVAIGFAENIWLDYFIALLLQLEDFPGARLNSAIPLRYYARFSPKKDSTEAYKNAELFINAMNQLHKEVDFNAYLRQSKPLYANALLQVQSGLPDARFISEMEAFYQGHFDAYTLIPSLTIPAGMGFGIKYKEGQQSNAVHVFGTFAPPAFSDTARLDMGFMDKRHLLELSTHEFGHSFVNPAVEQVPAALIRDTEPLYEPIREAMSDQAYTQWTSCLFEHFVRTGEIIIARNLGHNGDADRLKNDYIEGRKFIYLPIILAELEQYNAIRKVSYEEAVEKTMRALAASVKTR